MNVHVVSTTANHPTRSYARYLDITLRVSTSIGSRFIQDTAVVSSLALGLSSGLPIVALMSQPWAMDKMDEEFRRWFYAL